MSRSPAAEINRRVFLVSWRSLFRLTKFVYRLECLHKYLCRLSGMDPIRLPARWKALRTSPINPSCLMIFSNLVNTAGYLILKSIVLLTWRRDAWVMDPQKKPVPLDQGGKNPVLVNYDRIINRGFMGCFRLLLMI